MAYNRRKIFEQSKELIEKKKLFFIEDIIALLPISKPTFYEFFKVDSNEFNVLKSMLDFNRVEIKSAMRSKWYKSDNPTLQIALMKLISTTEEAHRLNGSHLKIAGDNENPINSKLTIEMVESGKIKTEESEE